MSKSDVIILGSGIAALQLANHIAVEKNVIILTKSKLKDSNSSLAQGGIAAAIGKNDAPIHHGHDTLEAGGFHNHEDVVFQVTKQAPALINELRNAGCPFDEDKAGQFHLGMEGAHSQKRIVHSGGDATGKHIIEFLASSLSKNVTIVEDFYAYELIKSNQGRCVGVKGKEKAGKISSYFAEHIVIATGGCGYLYQFTSNNPNITGDGIAMAYLAGAKLTDMEFMQFHPTLLYKDGRVHGLISEAVRGEGAILKTKDGLKIMEGVHPLKDLAPRHIVSQTIFDYKKKGMDIILDITPIADFKSKFPSITEICLENQIDLDKGFIPVVPGSHFLMGGIKVNKFGETNIPGLYAIGEASCTGLHGANRLASNSLLEGLAFGKRLAWLINSSIDKNIETEQPLYQENYNKNKPLLIPHLDVLREKMMDNVGIVRSANPLKNQQEWLERFYQFTEKNIELDSYSVSEIQSLLAGVVASIITDAALTRTESRGGHYRLDYPYEDNNQWLKKQLLYINGKGRIEEDEQSKTSVNVRAVLS